MIFLSIYKICLAKINIVNCMERNFSAKGIFFTVFYVRY